MCYRNGTGHRCECCGKEPKEIKFVMYGADELDNKPVSDRDRLCPETEEDFCSGQEITEPVLMIAVAPGEPMKIITALEVEEYFPDFEFEEDLAELPELGLMMSYQEKGVFQVGERYYLDLPFLIYNLDDHGQCFQIMLGFTIRKKLTVCYGVKGDNIAMINVERKVTFVV